MSLRKQIVLCAVAVAALFGGRAAGADENE